jgi:signal transduction histidine kinase/DNA-binding response OmpR family regulator
MALLEDESRARTLEQVRSATWSEHAVERKTNLPNFFLSDSAWWGKVSIYNASPKTLKRLFEVGSARYAQVTLYQIHPDGSYQTQTLSDATPVSERPYPTAFATFPVELPSQAETTFYMRVVSFEPLTMPVTLWQPEVYREKVSQLQLLYAFVLGVLIIMALYHLSYVFVLRDVEIIWYVLFLLFLAGFLLFRDRFILEVFSELALPNTRFLIFFSVAALGTNTLFLMSFLKVKSAQPRLFLACKYILTPLIVYGVVGAFLAEETFHTTMQVVLLTSVLSILLTSIILIQAAQGSQWDARLAISGKAVITAISVIEVMAMQGLLNAEVGRIYSFQIGFTLQALCYAFALAEKTRILRRENEKAQTVLIQQLQKADQLKDSFLANTSHELRTPLQGILGLAETLRSGRVTNTHRSLELIAVSVQRLSLLVDDILDAASLQSGQLRLQTEPVCLESVVAECLPLIDVRLSGRPISLLVEWDSPLPFVHADHNRLQQVLLNLFGNAAKFTQSGTIAIKAEVQDSLMKIQVVDTGIGMSAAELEKCFIPFEGQGTGLGLPLSKQLVESMQGTLAVSSAVGQGSTFEITLPIAKDEQLQHANLPAIDPIFTRQNDSSFSDPLRSQKGTILVVDDDPINCEVLSQQLHLLGLDATLEQSSRAAIQRVSEHKYDLVLLDIMMPEMSGFEVCQQIRRQYSPHELPIIFLTARSQLKDISQGYQLGANDYLVKPINTGELKARIFLHLESREDAGRSSEDANVALARRLGDIREAPALQAIDLKKYAVESMQMALQFWEERVEGGKRSLAEQSGLWSVHLESRGVFRTRNLDNYLDVQKFPKQPKWYKILQTIHYVQQALPTEHKGAAALEERLQQLFMELSKDA